MAKKLKTETEGKKAIMDVAGAKEAMAIVGKSLKAVNAEIDKLAALPTEGKAQRGMCAAMFAWGLGLKATGKAEFDKKLYDERFDDYVAKHWTDVKPAETVLRGYRSQYGAFCQASFAKFDATPMVRDCLSIANVVLPWRAARIREMLVTENAEGKEVERTKAPSKAEIAETLALDAKSGTPDAREGDSVFASVVNVLVGAAGDKGLIAYLAANVQYAEWLQPALKAAVDHRATVSAALKSGTKKEISYRTSVRVAREAMLAFNATAKGKGTGRRAGAAVH